jgi:hypothetical protein
LTCGRTLKCWLFTDDFQINVPYVSHYLEDKWLTEPIWKYINKWVFYIEKFIIFSERICVDIQEYLHT